MQWTLAIFGLALVLIAQDVTAQLTYPDTEVCTAPNRQTGTCINIKSCPPLLALVRQQPLTPETIETLQKSQCGFDGNDPKVCCTASSNQPTPPTPLNDDQPPDVSNHPNLRLLDHDICGPINANKIIGGNSTGVNEFPWMALLAYRKSGKNPEYRCGGTILNKRYILTAAHCVTNLPSGWWLTGIRVGEHDIRTERDCDKAGTFEEVCAEKYQDFGFESTLFHPGYSIKTLHNDIALIRLNRDIDFRPDNAKPICMPLGSAARIRSKKLLVSGWGITETTLASPVLLKAAMPIYPQDQCVDVYKLQTQIWHKQICVGGERNIDSCRGDSGGPLQGPTVYNGNSRYVQYGVVSFGVRRCGTLGFPGVYTRVDYYLDWILDNIRD